jgi:serralysin
MKNNIHAALIITLLTGFIFSATVQADTVQTRTYTNGGSTTQITKVYYDSTGKVTREEFDTNADGTIDKYSTSTYSSGRLISHELRTYGTNTLLYAVYRTYDESGRPATCSVDKDGDGTIDFVDSYSYSAQGIIDYTHTTTSSGVTTTETSVSSEQ